MEKECCQVKFTETDEGYRIDVTGKSLKEAFCCMPFFPGFKTMKAECCPPEEKEK